MTPQYKGIHIQLPKNKSMANEFIWNEAHIANLVNKYGHLYIADVAKEEVSSETDWEILAFEHNIPQKMGDVLPANFVLESDGLYHPVKPFGAKKRDELLSHLSFYISSVKRLSDGEVFSIGDMVDDGGVNKPIVKFEVNKSWVSGLFAHIKAGGSTDFFLLQKPAPEVKEPLFTTEDGKPVFLNDEVYLLQSWVIGKDKITQEDFFDDSFKYFSTKEAALEYIILNKPIYSIQEIINKCGLYPASPIVQSLKYLAKEKIKQ